MEYKSPNEVFDYTFDWTDDLTGAAFVSETLTMPDGLTLDLESNDGLKFKAVISGGVAGQQYLVTHQIEYTFDGATLKNEQRFWLMVQY